MERLRKRKDVTPKESEKRKQPTKEKTSEQTTSEQSTSVIGNITSRIAALATGTMSRATSVSSVASSVTSYQSSSKTRADDEPKLGRTIMTDLDEGATRFGKFRDLLEIDVLFIDGKDYTTNITEREVHKYICKRSLGIKREKIYAVKTLWRGHPRVIVRLKDKINIDRLPPTFEYIKECTAEDGSITTHKVVCEIDGVRISSETAHERPRENPNGPWTRWVKIEGTGFETNREKIKTVLSAFGTIESAFETHTISFLDDEPESGDKENEPKEVTLATGNSQSK